MAPGGRAARAWPGSWSSRGPVPRFPSSPLIAGTVEVPAVEISATEIRLRVREGRPVRYWVPDAVAEYMVRHRLYLDRRMIKNLMTAVFGTRFDRERRRIQPTVDAIHAEEEKASRT